MTKYNRVIVPVYSDTHGGHRLGLLNPETVLKEYEPDGNGGTEEILVPVSLSPAQEFVWNLYERHIKEVFKLAGKDPVIAIHNGDLTQGHKYKDGLVYSDVGNQIIIAENNQAPWFRYKNLKAMRLIWGTDSHIFGEGTTPRLVERLLSRANPRVDMKSYPHGLITIGKKVFDVAHHGPGAGIRSWLKGNQFRYYLKSLMDDEVKAGNVPPDIVLRAHVHTQVEEVISERYHFGEHRTHGFITPSYTLMNEYARQVTRSKPTVTLGMLVLEIVDNAINWHWLTETRDLRVKEEL